MAQFWEIAAGAAGIGAIGAFVMWSIYKQWLALPIPWSIDSRQQFMLFMTMLVLTFVFGVTALGAYVVTELYTPPKDEASFAVIAEARRPAITGSGLVSLAANDSFLSSKSFDDESKLTDQLVEWARDTFKKEYPDIANDSLNASVNDAGELSAPRGALVIRWYYREDPDTGEATRSASPSTGPIGELIDPEYVYVAYPFHEPVVLGPDFPASATLRRTDIMPVVVRSNIPGLEAELREALSGDGFTLVNEDRIDKLEGEIEETRTIGPMRIGVKKRLLDENIFYVVVDVRSR